MTACGQVGPYSRRGPRVLAQRTAGFVTGREGAASACADRTTSSRAELTRHRRRSHHAVAAIIFFSKGQLLWGRKEIVTQSNIATPSPLSMHYTRLWSGFHHPQMQAQ